MYIHTGRLLHSFPKVVRYIVYRMIVSIYTVYIECSYEVYRIYSYIHDISNIFLRLYQYLLIPPKRSTVSCCRILLFLYLTIFSVLVWEGISEYCKHVLFNYDLQLLCDGLFR